jgi:hypothetical protein
MRILNIGAMSMVASERQTSAWLPIEVAAEKMKRNADRIRAQIRNERLVRGQHFRVKERGVIELNVPAYLEWLDIEKERRKLPLTRRLTLQQADRAAGRYGAERTASLARVSHPPPRTVTVTKSGGPKLIPLWLWAEQTFGEFGPAKNTLRSWCRNGKILPVPRKVGREYFCSPDARYVDPHAERIERIVGGDE